MRILPLAAVLFIASSAFAQMAGEDPVENPVLEGRIVSVTPAEAKKGDTVVAKVELTSPKGWHIYGLEKGTSGVPTAFAVKEGPFQVGKGLKETPAPKVHQETYENGYEEKYPYHEGTVVFDVPLEVTGDAKPGEVKLTLKVHTMMCTMAVCLDETDTFYSATVKIIEGGVAKPPAVTDGAGQGGGGPPPADGAAKKGGFWAFIGLAVATGLITLITPCVFPMIPVTISFFTKQSSGGRGGTFALAAAYGIGIVVSYTAIGLIVSAALGKDGAQTFAANAWVNMAICAVFVVFAFSLFGWFEIVLPGALTNAVSASGRSGIVGALLLGLTFSITAFTCAAPFAASLLALSVQGERSWAVLGFLVYSGTMAVPFFCLGLFPNLLKKMPRSGGWLNSVKVVMGFVELAAACKFFANADFAWEWNFVSRSGVLACWTACGAASTLYLFNMFRLEHDDPATHIGVPRMLWGVVFAGLTLFTASGLVGRHLGIVEAYLPLPETTMWIGSGAGGNGGGAKGETHIETYAAALAEGKAQKKPVFLEFTAFS